MPNEIIIAGAAALLTGLLFVALLAQWLNAQAMLGTVTPTGRLGFAPPA
jgi:hypothetical protein